MHRYSKIHTHTYAERYGLRFRLSLVDFFRLSSSFLFFSLLNAFSQKRKHTFPTQHNTTTLTTYAPTQPRRGLALTHSRATVGWGGEKRGGEKGGSGGLRLIVDHSCWVLYAFLLSVCVCVPVYMCCAWWKCKVMMGASFNLPSAYRLPCGCSRRVSATVPPPFPLSLPYHRPRPICVVCVCVCVCAYKSHKSVQEVMSKQAVNMFV